MDFYNENKAYIESYGVDISNIDKAISNIDNKIKEREIKREKTKKEISKLESQIKSIKPVVEKINKLLSSFGFVGFKLEAVDDGKHYKIIRSGGKSAKETLSEGERNFVVFLYFYHLIHGVLNPEQNINEPKIVVFDDPVSSLDSEVLFIVATLIKEILRKVIGNEGNIKQVFVLTHNLFFFKEVTFISSRESQNNRKHTMYYIIKKRNNISYIESFNVNPIKTTYQLLWEEVKNENNNCVSLQNSMRRIIEFYFNLLANLKGEDLINKFEDNEERIICRSLISWVNVGSHDVFWGIDYMPQQGDITKFKQVFKKIFEKTGHSAHYHMMMDVEYSTESNNSTL